MSREVKFRAWDKRNKQMNKVWAIDYQINEVELSDEFDGAWSKFEDVILLQYTGLKDKDGVDIYEGDVVEAYFWNDKLKPVKKRGFIEFQSGSFIFNFGNGTWEYLDGNDAALVIGDIYENPELLENN